MVLRPKFMKASLVYAKVKVNFPLCLPPLGGHITIKGYGSYGHTDVGGKKTV